MERKQIGETDIGTDMDRDTDTDMQLGNFAKYLIWCSSLYSTIWITPVISWHNLHGAIYLKFSAPPDANNDKQIFKNSYRRWWCTPMDVSADWEISEWGLRKAAIRRMYSTYSNWKSTFHIPNLVHTRWRLHSKGLSLEGDVQIQLKSRHFYLLARFIWMIPLSAKPISLGSRLSKKDILKWHWHEILVVVRLKYDLI
jgi:hypothetical protein